MRAIAEACGLSSACGRSHIEDHIHATLAKQSVHLGRFETAVSTLSSLNARKAVGAFWPHRARQPPTGQPAALNRQP